MLIFATSDKGGTGRSVTSCNLAYRSALRGENVCYLDFDFGSPTAGAVFGVEGVARGTESGGVHEFLLGHVLEPHRVDVWAKTERESVRRRTGSAGDLILLPGDQGGGEFASTPEIIARCRDLFLRLEEEFDMTFVDLAAGRSYATEIALAVVALPEFADARFRWLVFHRWTQQHVIAAAGLLNGEHGLLDIGTRLGHDAERLRGSTRFVRTAVMDPNSEVAGLKASQVAWLVECDSQLRQLAGSKRIGLANTLGMVPLDPVLQWREQILTATDTHSREIANVATVQAFETLAERLTDDTAWETL